MFQGGYGSNKKVNGLKMGVVIKKNILFILLISCTFALNAQDTKLSHPFMWKSFNNPGYSGFDGRMAVSFGAQKAFWGNPLDFRSYFLAVDVPFTAKRTVGLGGVSVFAQRDEEGTLMYATNTLAATISARARILRNTVIQLGIQPCVYQKSIDPDRILLGDQLDSYYGKILNVSPEMMQFYKNKITLFDFAAGIYGQTGMYLRNGSLASFDYGLSLYHIIEPSQSFLSENGSLAARENLINRRMSMYLSYTHPVVIFTQVNTTVSPYFMYEKQGVQKNIQWGAYCEGERIGLFGVGMKKDQYSGLNLSSLLFHLGLYLDRGGRSGWKICYTYEMPANQGTIYKNSTHSLSLHWFLRRNPARELNRFDNSPNNKKTRQKKVECESRWFGREKRQKVRL